MTPATNPRRRIMMCPPGFFSVEYVINPWMEGNEQRAVQARAAEQWNALYEAITPRADVEILEPSPGVPDLVFTANAGLAYGNKIVLSSFRHPERQLEEPINKKWFVERGFEVIEMPRNMSFEGAGDGLFDRGAERLWLGYGFRTELGASDFVAQSLGIEVIPLRLVDERFYHLDTCFCPLTGGYLIYFPTAFDERARRLIEEMVPANRRFAVSERDALAFACNAVDTGKTVILNNCTPELEGKLNEWGFDVIKTKLSEFMLAGGAAKCLTLRIDEPLFLSSRIIESTFVRSETSMEGHLLDTGLLARMMDLITENGGNFEVMDFRAGNKRDDKSFVRLSIDAPSQEVLDKILGQLHEIGARIADAEERPATLREVDMDGVAPDDFYCSTIYPTDVLVYGQWIRAQGQRMDGTVVVERNGRGEISARITLIRDLRRGDQIVCGVDGIKIHPKTEAQEDPSEFKFMSSSVSSERRVEVAVDAIAWEMSQIRNRGGKIVLVSGPVAVHTGGIPYLSELVRQGFINAVLTGNALAVHDIEKALYGTSLGVDLKRGVTVHGGHRHHLTAINAIRRAGSIKRAVELGVLKEGLMFELVKANVPFCLAGSIRDDGPLPDTEMDMIRAQQRYQELLRGADMILMLSTMLHSIGVGNMTPAGVRLVCVDINTAVATKLADRGSVESTPVVTDVGLFLNLLVRKMSEMKIESVLAE